LLLGGSPCQNLSKLGDRKGLEGKKSGLFYEFLRIKNEINATHFLMENVKPKKEYIDIINKELNCEAIEINSNIFVPQSRTRLYWTNIPYITPEPKKTSLLEILEENYNEKYLQSKAWNIWWNKNKQFQLKKSYSSLDKDIAICLTARMYASWNGNFITTKKGIRRLTVGECETLQGVPHQYTTKYVSDNEAYKMLGNGWTVDVIAHILKGIKQIEK
jgi:site-specific DNA-cytosine methylase